ncbi:MAG TPA: DUF5698 domain-containing protein [Anaerolineales bacterium]|nr:DUF5698 domain-containing protein [Anaerolineales bacterium]
MFSFVFSLSAWLAMLMIFCLRVTDMSLDTLRMLFVVRGRKGIAWTLGFFEAAVYIVAITRVLSNLSNPLTILGYAAGFATGNVVGMLIEERLAIGHIQMSIVSSARGVALAQALRDTGFAVTEVPARGKDGMVHLLNMSVLRKDVPQVEHVVHDIDSEAFVTSADVRPVRRGFWGA